MDKHQITKLTNVSKQAGIYIGTSGWVYPGWIGNFYPEKIKPKEVLPFYMNVFNSVELNNSFYRIPKEEYVKMWRDTTPQDFVFSCKANRYISHMKRLKEVEETVDKLLHVFSCFEQKLGPILFQFPPYWPVNMERLAKFIAYLPKDFQYTFEFRHQSWFCDALYELLTRNRMALCFYDIKTYQTPEVVTGDFIYLRMHGPELEPYQGAYSAETLAAYAAQITHWRGEGKAVYCYFDNTIKACAPVDAQRLRQQLRLG